MSNDLPDFLGGEPASAPEALAPAADPAPQAATEGQDEGQPRGPDGKFASPTPPSAEPAPQAAQPQPEPHAVPITALLEERERRQAAERRAQELQTWRDQQEAERQRQAPPDPQTDPAGYQAYRDAQVSMSLYEYGRDISKRFAVMQHGEDTVNAAYEWGVKRCDEDPAFNAKLLASKDPYGIVLAEWKRDQIASKVDPTDYEAYLAWKASQQPGGQPPGGQPQAHQASAVTPPAKPAAPRPSLAAAPSAGSHAAPEARDGEAQFNAMFR